MLVGFAAGCGRARDASLERVREHGLRAGFAAERPYAFVDTAGTVQGESAATLVALSARLGVQPIHWVPFEFAELIPALNAGRIDVIASGMFITADRSALVRFTRPTVCSRPALVLAPDAMPTLTAASAGDCADCRIIVLSGGVEEDAAVALGFDQRLTRVPDIRTAVAALRTGRAEALLISAPTARELVRRNPDLRLAAPSISATVRAPGDGCAAFAFRLTDVSLADAYDRELGMFVGSDQHRSILKTFGFVPDELARAR